MNAESSFAMVERLRTKLDPIVAEFAETLGTPKLQAVSTVNLICGSSRCGSSWLFRFLSQSPQLASPRGEQVPFEKLYLFPTLTSRRSDRLAEVDLQPKLAEKIWRLLALDLGTGSATEESTAGYDEALQVRLSLQFPRTLHPALVHQELKECPSGRRRFGELLRRLSAKRLIRPEYYDRDPLFHWDGVGCAEGPPDDHVVLEEPPFIPILPRRPPPTGTSINLLLKSSLHSYRLPFMVAMFGNARIRIILLTRNPAASINGLMDGWLSPSGYFSYDLSLVDQPLKLPGYSERYGWGSRWWKFDLPPTQRDIFSLPIERVCALQWTSAYENILGFLTRNPNVCCLRIRYEDLIQGPQRRLAVLRQVTDFLGVEPMDTGTGLLPDGVIMATHTPQPARWRSRYRQIVPLLRDTNLGDICEQLGYEPREYEQWS